MYPLLHTPSWRVQTLWAYRYIISTGSDFLLFSIDSYANIRDRRGGNQLPVFSCAGIPVEPVSESVPDPRV